MKMQFMVRGQGRLIMWFRAEVRLRRNGPISLYPFRSRLALGSTLPEIREAYDFVHPMSALLIGRALFHPWKVSRDEPLFTMPPVFHNQLPRPHVFTSTTVAGKELRFIYNQHNLVYSNCVRLL